MITFVYIGKKNGLFLRNKDSGVCVCKYIYIYIYILYIYIYTYIYI